MKCLGLAPERDVQAGTPTPDRRQGWANMIFPRSWPEMPEYPLRPRLWLLHWVSIRSVGCMNARGTESQASEETTVVNGESAAVFASVMSLSTHAAGKLHVPCVEMQDGTIALLDVVRSGSVGR